MGPLQGVKIVELAATGPGPAPFCAMMLADMGAEVVRVDRPPEGDPGPFWSRRAVLNRGRRSVALDLKHPDGVATLLRLVEAADGLVEGFRPGVCERLGVGPAECLARNPRLVYGRVTGWGQDGPLAGAAGHDINYIALTGALHIVGRAGTSPVPPANLVGDFGGGGMLLAFGLLCGIVEAQRSARGQVVDAAMVDGTLALMAQVYALHSMGQWSNERGTNLLDGGAPFYDVYETADGRYVSVAAIEPHFYAELLRLLALDDGSMADQMDQRRWPEYRRIFARRFREHTREEWIARLEGTDACFAPVLDLDEAPDHRHLRAREAFVRIADVAQPTPAPRFSRSAPSVPGPPPAAGEHTEAVLADWGISPDEIVRLRDARVLGSGVSRTDDGGA